MDDNFKVGQKVKHINSLTELNSFIIEYVHDLSSKGRGYFELEEYPRYDISNIMTNEYVRGCYLHNGSWELIN